MADKTPFELALDFTLKWEGGFVQNPADPGGATKYGITQKTLDSWRDQHHFMRSPVKDMALEEARTIYKALYWLPMVCDSWKTPLAVALFDTAVNFGVGGASRMLRAEHKAGGGDDHLAIAICHHRAAKRQHLVEQNPRLRVFLKGWINRDAALEKYVRSLMNGGGG